MFLTDQTIWFQNKSTCCRNSQEISHHVNKGEVEAEEANSGVEEGVEEEEETKLVTGMHRGSVQTREVFGVSNVGSWVILERTAVVNRINKQL